jgi:hypothetical protein
MLFLRILWNSRRLYLLLYHTLISEIINYLVFIYNLCINLGDYLLLRYLIHMVCYTSEIFYLSDILLSLILHMDTVTLFPLYHCYLSNISIYNIVIYYITNVTSNCYFTYFVQKFPPHYLSMSKKVNFLLIRPERSSRTKEFLYVYV